MAGLREKMVRHRKGKMSKAARAHERVTCKCNTLKTSYCVECDELLCDSCILGPCKVAQEKWDALNRLQQLELLKKAGHITDWMVRVLERCQTPACQRLYEHAEARIWQKDRQRALHD